MINFEIREARPTDVAELVRLCAAHAAHENATYDPAGKQDKLISTLFDTVPRMHCFVVEIDSSIVGYATFGLQFSSWLAAEYLYLDCLFIDSEFRGAGIGQRLLDLIYSRAEQLGCSEVQWQTPDFNSDAIRFYDRNAETSRSQKLRYVWPVQARSTRSTQRAVAASHEKGKQ